MWVFEVFRPFFGHYQCPMSRCNGSWPGALASWLMTHGPGSWTMANGPWFMATDHAPWANPWARSFDCFVDAPYRGQILENSSSRVLNVFRNNYCFFMVYYWFKMANSGMGIVSNLIFSVFGSFQISSKSGTLDPVFYVRILQTYEKIPNHFLNILFL